MIMYIIVQLVNVYTFLIFIYVLMSWLPVNHGVLADIYHVLGRICDPYLNLFRKMIPPIGGIIDITPIIALLVLQFAVRFLAWLI